LSVIYETAHPRKLRTKSGFLYPFRLLINSSTIKFIKMETAVMTNKESVQALYDLFGQGNVPAILDLVTDDITWTCPGPTDILPYAQVYHGKKGVAEFFKLIYANKDFPKFEVKELIEEDNKVVALGHWDAKSKKTGNPYSGDWAMVFYFRDGKLYEHKEFYDSYGEAMASKG
jgi:ketosteroid isomerase-like protein